MRLRILTWNIHKGIGGVDRRYRPERIVSVIAHYDPDVVLLQEVDEGAKRSQRHRQVDHIGDALELPHRAYGPNVTLRRGGQYGNAILSRWPVDDVHNFDLTVKPKKRRAVLFARCHVPIGTHTRLMAIFNMHLGLAGFERNIQLKRFLKTHPFDQFRARTPIVAGGDFNDLWGTLGKKHFEPAGFARAGALVNTYPAALPMRPLDGLYVRGDLTADRCFRSRMTLAREASDHVPLVADCTIRRL
ncbi:MAG: endonuclease/exonuclease/phosphatase family protein [Planctomycetota bacterium]|nr:endonuclease/exonuclease/phosphatase family protein [Planctomycetota bacterium]